MSNEAGTSRGEFLKRTAGATGLVVGAGVWTRGALAAPQADPAEAVVDPTITLIPSRSFTSGHFALELDGASVGLLKSVAGGNTFAEVVTEQPGSSYYAHKHITAPEYEEFTIQCGLTMDDAFFGWVAESWEGHNERKDGAIVAADFQYDVKSRREFFGALISETTIPTLNGASKDIVFLTVKFAPELAQSEPGNGKLTVPAVQQKLWQSANFRLEIDGLDTSRVAKIDAFTIKQQFVSDQIGEVRDPVREPGKVGFPNLTITLSVVGADSWYAWFDDFVIQGLNGQADERNGTLRFLAPNLTDELGQVRFSNLGIFKLATETMEAGTIQRIVAELYCERMELEIA